MKYVLCKLVLILVILFSHSVTGQQANYDVRALRSSDTNESLVKEFSGGQTVIVFAHQDDDLLWMLPFWPVAQKFLLTAYPAAPMFDEIIKTFPSRIMYHERWRPIWNSVDNDIWAEVFTDRCKRAPIITLEGIKSHLRPFLAPPIKRVITHNNWGEYGHAQHRLVNIAVRQLAVEMHLDVWALGTHMDINSNEQSQYINVADKLGLPTIEGYFDPDLFREVRAAYMAKTPHASSPELTAKLKKWSQTFWTWSDNPDGFLMGWRPFIKLVDNGIDLTINNAEVKRLEQDVQTRYDCTMRPSLPKP